MLVGPVQQIKVLPVVTAQTYLIQLVVAVVALVQQVKTERAAQLVAVEVLV
jgi:hypothetical protein